MQYQTIYPEGDVTLTDLTKAALAECGSEHVTIVSGLGSQVVRVQAECVERVMERVGLLMQEDPHEEPEPPHAPPSAEPKTASGAGAEGSESPDPDASTPPKTTTDPAARPGGRAAGSAAKKTTSNRRASRTKEG